MQLSTSACQPHLRLATAMAGAWHTKMDLPGEEGTCKRWTEVLEEIRDVCRSTVAESSQGLAEI